MNLLALIDLAEKVLFSYTVLVLIVFADIGRLLYGLEKRKRRLR